MTRQREQGKSDLIGLVEQIPLQASRGLALVGRRVTDLT